MAANGGLGGKCAEGEYCGEQRTVGIYGDGPEGVDTSIGRGVRERTKSAVVSGEGNFSRSMEDKREIGEEEEEVEGKGKKGEEEEGEEEMEHAGVGLAFQTGVAMGLRLVISEGTKRT